MHLMWSRRPFHPLCFEGRRYFRELILARGVSPEFFDRLVDNFQLAFVARFFAGELIYVIFTKPLLEALCEDDFIRHTRTGTKFTYSADRVPSRRNAYFIREISIRSA